MPKSKTIQDCFALLIIPYFWVAESEGKAKMGAETPVVQVKVVVLELPGQLILDHASRRIMSTPHIIAPRTRCDLAATLYSLLAPLHEKSGSGNFQNISVTPPRTNHPFILLSPIF